jgi:hypothetical protein
MSYGMSGHIKGAYEGILVHTMESGRRLTESYNERTYGPNWREVLEGQRKERERIIAEQKANPVPLTLESLIKELGWTTEFAEHFVQPYCTCTTGGYDYTWDECSHSPGGGGPVS